MPSKVADVVGLDLLFGFVQIDYSTTSMKKGLFTVIALSCILLTMAEAFAIQITVLGLFKGQAIVMIDNQQYQLTQGESAIPGVTLISANSEQAEFEVDGERRTLTLGHVSQMRIKPPRQLQIRIVANQMGMYIAHGYINGSKVELLIDTGATLVALNRPIAKRLGVSFVNARPVNVLTAAGTIEAQVVRLRSVKLGPIELKEIDAVVLMGAQPETSLLGMSFLSHLHIENQGSTLVLTKKY